MASDIRRDATGLVPRTQRSALWRYEVSFKAVRCKRSINCSQPATGALSGNGQVLAAQPEEATDTGVSEADLKLVEVIAAT